VSRPDRKTHSDNLSTIGRDLKRCLWILGGFVLLLWAVEFVDLLLFGGSLDRLGIQPRTVGGLVGVPLHPLLHRGFGHVALNSIGLLLFGSLVIFREERDFWTAIVLGTLIGGLGVWLFGRPSIHVGASGVVFALFGYLLLTGWFDRSFGAILLSVVVFLLWGSALFGLSPTQVGISWEAHLFGFFAGGLTAWLRARRGRAIPSSRQSVP
jgi:membrane associated rhomboid family serine protease